MQGINFLNKLNPPVDQSLLKQFGSRTKETYLTRPSKANISSPGMFQAAPRVIVRKPIPKRAFLENEKLNTERNNQDPKPAKKIIVRSSNHLTSH